MTAASRQLTVACVTNAQVGNAADAADAAAVVQAALALPAAPTLDVCSLDAVAAAVSGATVGVATVAAGLQMMALMTTLPALMPQSPTPNSDVATVLAAMVRLVCFWSGMLLLLGGW